MRYELFYLIGASKEAELEKIKSEVREMVVSLGGVFEEKETFEKRKMSYEIKHETHGLYIAQRFELEDTSKVQDLNNKLNLYTGVLRFILSRADELPELQQKDKGGARKETYAPKKEVVAETPAKKEEPTVTEKKEEAAAPAESEPTPAPEAETPKEQLPEPKSPSVSDEDIDKKLEEILNI